MDNKIKNSRGPVPSLAEEINKQTEVATECWDVEGSAAAMAAWTSQAVSSSTDSTAEDLASVSTMELGNSKPEISLVRGITMAAMTY